MIADYRGLAVFVAIADAGSLSAAGRGLRLSTSVVSHHLSRLEARLGVALFFRSTRSMSLTPEGRAALGAARRMVEAGEAALDALSAVSAQPVGALRIAMPAFGERTYLRQTIWEFARLYPMVAISLRSSDERVDLVKEGFDLAIRLGTLADSGLRSRRVSTFRRVLVAAPEYLAARPPVRTLEDLRSCEFIAISMLPDRMTMEHDGATVSFLPENFRLEVDTIASAKSAIMAGLGVQHLPLSEVEREIAAGALVQVLPRYSFPDLGVYAVWPDTGAQKTLTRRLIEFFLSRADARAD